MADDWGWWAGRSSHVFDVGPCKTKEDAIEEALADDSFEEVETESGWRRQVYFAECCGLHFDCDECGVVPEACDGCKEHLDIDETGGTFAGVRNAGSVLLPYDDPTP